MNKNLPKGQFCQSCSMPMEKPDDFGTNIDNSKNKEYCCHCYQDGKFTEPGITMEQMIEKCAGTMKQMNLPKALIGQTKTVIPTLKRWKK